MIRRGALYPKKNRWCRLLLALPLLPLLGGRASGGRRASRLPVLCRGVRRLRRRCFGSLGRVLLTLLLLPLLRLRQRWLTPCGGRCCRAVGECVSRSSEARTMLLLWQLPVAVVLVVIVLQIAYTAHRAHTRSHCCECPVPLCHCSPPPPLCRIASSLGVPMVRELEP